MAGTTRSGDQQADRRATITVKFEGRFRHKDGSYRWLSWTGVPDQDRIYAVARDVTAGEGRGRTAEGRRGGAAVSRRRWKRSGS